jgi:hypothetical protein
MDLSVGALWYDFGRPNVPSTQNENENEIITLKIPITFKRNLTEFVSSVTYLTNWQELKIRNYKNWILSSASSNRSNITHHNLLQ